MNKYSRVYIEPSVNVIDASHSDVDFYLWLESRAPVCQYRTDPNTDRSTLVKVGTEEITNVDDYRTRVRRMGLQYTNFKDYTFEIQGSTLFRDILFTLNKCPQWATSLRFVNSLFTGFDTRNYPISAEYKGIEEWEAQFDKYMDKINETMVTDENRVEMPYSMSSKYWVKLNLKTLVGFLSMLRFKMPYFYSIYGRRMENAIKKFDGFEIEKYYVPYIDSSIAQYFTYYKDEEFEESIKYDGDSVHLKITMGLLLFSQFIRQQDSCIKGLYDMLVHEPLEVDEFKHKLFYASTPINVDYVADINRFMRTESNRTCWFSMSSGNDINSWSKVLDISLDGITLSGFKDVIPCGRSKDCVQCKFKEDVKFRQEGLEVRNLPCGIALMDEDIINKRVAYDNNNLSKMYKELYEHFKELGVKPLEI